MVKLENKPQIAVTESGKPCIRPVKHILTKMQHLPSPWAVKGAYNMQEGGFAYAGRTYNANDLPLADRGGKTLENIDCRSVGGITLFKILYLKNRFFSWQMLYLLEYEQ